MKVKMLRTVDMWLSPQQHVALTKPKCGMRVNRRRKIKTFELLVY